MDQVDKLIQELEREARLTAPTLPPPKHFNARSGLSYVEETVYGIHSHNRDTCTNPSCQVCNEEARAWVRSLVKENWTWGICKKAFPHDIDAATRLYKKIHGEDPPYLKGV